MVAVGDLVLLLAFVVIGRWSHHELNAGGWWATFGTAAPFLVGWGLAALPLGTYARQSLVSLRSSTHKLLLAWPVALVVALLTRSIVDHEIPALAFILVAFGFNLLTLFLWRALVVALQRLRSSGLH